MLLILSDKYSLSDKIRALYPDICLAELKKKTEEAQTG
jgi:hypothetical protein